MEIIESLLWYLLWGTLAFGGLLIIAISVINHLGNKKAIEIYNEELWNQYAKTSNNSKHYILSGNNKDIRMPIKYSVAKKKGYLPTHIKNNKHGKFTEKNGSTSYIDTSSVGFFDVSGGGDFGGGDCGGGGGD